jgi:hypothetical protein
MKETHVHEIDLSIGIIRFHQREPHLNYRVVTHGGIEKAILRDSELDRNSSSIDGEIISVKSEILYDIDIEEMGFKEGFKVKVPSRILLHAHPNYKNKDISKIPVTILRYGDYGCAILPVKNGEIDAEPKSSGDYHIKIIDAFRDDKEKSDEPPTPSELTEGESKANRYKCRVVLPQGKFQCWNEAVKAYIRNGGDEKKVGIGLDGLPSWSPVWGIYHKKYRLFIENKQVDC